MRTATAMVCLALWGAGLTETIRAEEMPLAGKRDLRVRYVDYKADDVVLVATQLFTSTQVELAADETVTFIAIGNPSWDVVPKNNLLFIKPRERHPPTNVNVVAERSNGERRSYQLRLGIMAEGATDPPFYLVKFVYSGDEAQARRLAETARSAKETAAQADRLLARDEKNGPRNFAYAVQGEADFEPVEVFDNGKITTLRFRGATDLPAIYIGRDDGREELVPKNVNGDLVMVHAIARKLILRRGAAVMCVFNEAFRSEGLEPATKTTSPVVTRTFKTDAPTVIPPGEGKAAVRVPPKK